MSIPDNLGVNVKLNTSALGSLLKTPFSYLLSKEICELKTKHPTPKLQIKEGGDQNQNWTSQLYWYEQFSWV